MSANVETLTLSDGTERTAVTNEDGTQNRTYVKVEETFCLMWERIEGMPMRMGSYESIWLTSTLSVVLLTETPLSNNWFP